MKKFLIYLILFHSFGSAWIFGFAEPGVFSLAIDSDKNCVKFNGVEQACTQDDVNLMNNLFILYTN